MTLPAAARPVAFILTADRAKAVPFYRDTLGLPMLAEEQFGVVFDLGGGATLRLTDLAGHEPGPHTVLGWEVDDITAAMADLAARGVTFQIYEGFGQDEHGVWQNGDTRIAWFNDPEGNNLSIAQHG
ncbi:VOC family protein [Tsuneonella sp. HG222]